MPPFCVPSVRQVVKGRAIRHVVEVLRNEALTTRRAEMGTRRALDVPPLDEGMVLLVIAMALHATPIGVVAQGALQATTALFMDAQVRRKVSKAPKIAEVNALDASPMEGITLVVW